MSKKRHAPLAPLFLISAAAVGFEIALTRFFAIASWSEYGYWVISITMVGFAVSGVVLSLFKDFFVRHSARLLFLTPLLLLVTAAVGYYFTIGVPFNPLEFQNPGQWGEQLTNIGKYYAALFPFYFLTGTYISLYFVTFQADIPKIYGADLIGAGAGSLLVLMLMFWLHPFYLLVGLLPLLAIAGFYHLPARRRPRLIYFMALAAAVVGSELVVLRYNQADFNEYKSIYPPLNVQGNRIVDEIRSPRGYFLVLDNFTERLDVDLSNNFKTLGAKGTPSTLGLYADGNRLTSLRKPGDESLEYLRASLDAFPYEVTRVPDVLLIGTRGGFRVREALKLGAGKVTALEPDATLYTLLKTRGHHPALDDPRVQLRNASPAEIAAEGRARFDIIDIASDFLNQADVNKYVFTVEAVQANLGLLRDDGVLSVPVSIREYTVYAIKLLATVREALVRDGVAAPERHVIVYRSSWNVRILVSKQPFSPATIVKLRRFADDRSFDTSYFPGIRGQTIKVWNDLPGISFANQTVEVSDRASDSLRDDALRLFADRDGSWLRGHFFRLEPSTHDRPFFYSILDLGKLDTILKRIEAIPREEIGYLINVAVLVQSVILALLVLGLPLLRYRRGTHPKAKSIVKSILYFAGLGLGFLFMEIWLIDKAAWFLSDRTYAFAIVLTVMLVSSGIGSALAGRFTDNPRQGLTYACVGIFTWVIVMAMILDPLLQALLGWPLPLKVAVLVVLSAPLGVALGFPFPLGLTLFRGKNSHFLPWAWSLNGSFSVVATPLANLLAVSAGYKLVLFVSLLLYIIVYLAFPAAEGRNRVS